MLRAPGGFGGRRFLPLGRVRRTRTGTGRFTPCRGRSTFRPLCFSDRRLVSGARGGRAGGVGVFSCRPSRRCCTDGLAPALCVAVAQEELLRRPPRKALNSAPGAARRQRVCSEWRRAVWMEWKGAHEFRSVPHRELGWRTSGRRVGPIHTTNLKSTRHAPRLRRPRGLLREARPAHIVRIQLP